MADYFTQLRPASFRGIAFDLPDDEKTLGSRIARYEYPGRDGAVHDHLGGRAVGYTLTAIIVGEDWQRASAALEKALRTAGPGQLIHPVDGETTVTVLDVRRQISTAGLGEVRYQITVEEYTAPDAPVAGNDTAAALGLSSGAMFTALEDNFNAVFKSVGIPDFLTADALSRANSFTDQLKGVLSEGGLLNMVGSIIPNWQSLGDGFAGEVVGLFSNIVGLVRPRPRPIIGSRATSTADRTQVRSLMTALSKASGISIVDTASAATSTASTRQSNATALDNLFRGASLSAMTAVAQYATYESREDAISFRQSAAGQLDDMRTAYGNAGWDQSWQAAGGQLAALSRDINDRIGRLPRTVTVRPQTVRNSVALAHRLYGDDLAAIFDQADDIVKRNKVRHPGFVPSSELEVLVDA